jgi:hypothetical protein
MQHLFLQFIFEEKLSRPGMYYLHLHDRDLGIWAVHGGLVYLGSMASGSFCA